MYKGLPEPIICDYLSWENAKQFYEKGTEFQIGKIEMVTQLIRSHHFCFPEKPYSHALIIS